VLLGEDGLWVEVGSPLSAAPGLEVQMYSGAGTRRPRLSNHFTAFHPCPFQKVGTVGEGDNRQSTHADSRGE